ncbi:phosphotransferase [Nonomuraea sp. NN258]|uniref:phosphotransferase n=1 Tax=Nonomuraea antri TaxID=2730852 RepID=UPI001568C1F2|nr:phosphotransferase [Nonomuraea antri]NRQ34378.1 phosphotransferase [Nonomuraea antri]
MTLLTGDVPPPFGVRRFRPLPTFSHGAGAPHTGVPAERDFGDHVDQTNYSVVVGDQVVVKWLTPPVRLPHRTPEILAHLTDTGFNETAPPYAALTRADEHGELLLALITGYLPDAEDGWEWCVADAESGSTAFASHLGRLAADLHLSLSTLEPGGPEAGPEGGPPADPADLAARAERALDEALSLTDGTDGAWLRARAGDLRAELAALARPVTTPRIRIHGDLHVGQILRWRDGYAVIDFDGNPTVADPDAPQPAARDVAQLTTSLEHVAQVAIKRRGTPPADAASWAAGSREALLTAYRARLSEHGAADLLDTSLIRPFEIEQECRELIYAARHLPRWRYAPMGVLRTWYTEETTP